VVTPPPVDPVVTAPPVDPVATTPPAPSPAPAPAPAPAPVVTPPPVDPVATAPPPAAPAPAADTAPAATTPAAATVDPAAGSPALPAKPDVPPRLVLSADPDVPPAVLLAAPDPIAPAHVTTRALPARPDALPDAAPDLVVAPPAVPDAPPPGIAVALKTTPDTRTAVAPDAPLPFAGLPEPISKTPGFAALSKSLRDVATARTDRDRDVAEPATVLSALHGTAILRDDGSRASRVIALLTGIFGPISGAAKNGIPPPLEIPLLFLVVACAVAPLFGARLREVARSGPPGYATVALRPG
ncbi:MAG TPA: hypothetical protein VKD47_06610, partial [Miltoncostaeaceae bacterium]|nr:hypothetical protein [Miltoncostaeaceae bacterium]